MLVKLLTDGSTDGLLCDFGMPVMHQGVRYNCRVLCLNGDILLIRPKLFLANDGNYRETRWFTRWHYGWVLQDFALPAFVAQATRSRQTSVKIGPGMLQLLDTVVASETCEELFTPNSPHITLALNGAEILTNGSGSHHNLRKLDRRMKLITEAVAKSGGCYLYANQLGCDGGRLYYDGCALICDNGHILAQGSQFSLNEVEVVTAAVDLSRTRSMRGSFMSRCEQVVMRQESSEIAEMSLYKSPIHAPHPACAAPVYRAVSRWRIHLYLYIICICTCASVSRALSRWRRCQPCRG